jgi:hypothetical protein
VSSVSVGFFHTLSLWGRAGLCTRGVRAGLVPTWATRTTSRGICCRSAPGRARGQHRR